MGYETEKDLLLGSLNQQRKHLFGSLEGLSEELDAGESAEDVFGLYRAEIERSNAVITATQLDMAPRQPDPGWKEWGIDFPDLRSIMIHMIEETACHAGHLDAVRNSSTDVSGSSSEPRGRFTFRRV
jgi:hypothetical protein